MSQVCTTWLMLNMLAMKDVMSKQLESSVFLGEGIGVTGWSWWGNGRGGLKSGVGVTAWGKA